jgi:hypothetical protein
MSLRGTCLLAILTVLGFPAVSRAEPGVDTPTETINRVLAGVWKSHKVTPPARMTDEQFLRRATQDILGRLPTAKELEDFARATAVGKRPAAIDRLVASPEWAAHWSKVWTTWLVPEDYKPAYREQLRKWLESRLSRGMSYRDMVTALIEARGTTSDNGAVHFVLANLGNPLPEDLWTERGQFDVVPVTARTMKVFLGKSGHCIECHDHPYDPDLRQRQFWGMNVFFRQVERNGQPCDSPGVAPELQLGDNSRLHTSGTVRFARRNGLLDATGMTFIDGRQPRRIDGASRRQLLTGWLVRQPDLHAVHVDRTWRHLLGRGLLEDDTLGFCSANEPLYPELLRGLSQAFSTSEGGLSDQARLIAWICKSDVYQLLPPSEESDPGRAFFFRRKN